MSVAFRLPPPSASSGPQPRPSTPSVPCRISTARIHAKCSLPDLNRENPRQVFPAGPQPRPPTPSVPCRTSTARIHAKCSLPDLNRRRECQEICQISGTLSDVLSGILIWHSYLAFLSGILLWHSIWHSIWHSYLALYLTLCLGMFVCLAQVVHRLVSVAFLQTCLTGGVPTCLGMFVCLAQVVRWPVWSCLSKPVESFGVYFTWPTDMFISCLTD